MSVLFDPIMDRQSPDKKLFISAGSSKTLTLNQRHVFIAGGSPDTVVTMPNVSEAEGRSFVLSATTVPATTGAKITVNYGNQGATASATISTTGVELTFYSTGVVWQVVRSS